MLTELVRGGVSPYEMKCLITFCDVLQWTNIYIYCVWICQQRSSLNHHFSVESLYGGKVLGSSGGVSLGHHPLLWLT